MKSLVDKERWDILYKKTQGSSPCSTKKANWAVKGLRKYFCPYSDYLLWNAIFSKYLPKNKNAKALEVGSAPGDFLVRLHQTYGFIPYGVEYSEPGVIQNKNLFHSYNIDADNVIHADFFDDKFQERYKEHFDIVISRGFIEHFNDLENVIDKHVNLLAGGGRLIVSIPNLNRSSFYGTCAALFHKERLEMHNLDIMSKDAFTRLFDKKELLNLFCDYYGTLRLRMVSPGNILPVKLAVYAFSKLDPLLSPLLRLAFRDKGAESRFFSPGLLYIGIKSNRKTTGNGRH